VGVGGWVEVIFRKFCWLNIEAVTESLAKEEANNEKELSQLQSTLEELKGWSVICRKLRARAAWTYAGYMS